MVHLQLLEMKEDEWDSDTESLDPWESESKTISWKPHLCVFITIAYTIFPPFRKKLFSDRKIFTSLSCWVTKLVVHSIFSSFGIVSETNFIHWSLSKYTVTLECLSIDLCCMLCDWGHSTWHINDTGSDRYSVNKWISLVLGGSVVKWLKREFIWDRCTLGCEFQVFRLALWIWK